MTEKKTFWLSKRLKEIDKTKVELAKSLGIASVRLTELEQGRWKFQASHIRKAAEFLNFDTYAFLDFIAGDITEEQLWAAKPPVKITDQDLQLLQAVKSLATPKEATNDIADSQKQAQIPTGKEQER